MGNQKHQADAAREKRRDRARSGSGRSDPNAQWRGFVAVDWTAERKADCNAWIEAEYDNLPVLLDEAVKDGLRITLKVGERDDAPMVSITTQRDHGGRAGIGVTARGAEIVAALWRALYIHYRLTQGDWVRWLPAESADTDPW